MRKSLEDSFGKDNLDRIRSVRIGIAGCGGLGSNCALNLLRCGFIRFKLVDYDIVESHNLNRQFFFLDQVGMPKVGALTVNLKRVNPEAEIEGIQKKISRDNIADLFADCDIIVEGFDREEYKAMLALSLVDESKFVVMASGIAGFGNSDSIVAHRLKKGLVIVGDLKTGVDSAPPLSPRVNIAAAKQADIILEYVLKG